MFTIIRNILSNVWYVLSGAKKADDELERKFIAILERRHEQRMSPEYDWDTMTHPDDALVDDLIKLKISRKIK